MRRQLLLTIALAMLGMAIAAGSVNATSDGDALVGSGEGSVTIDLPDGQDLPPVGDAPDCANLEDDDADELTDLDDPDCSGPLDTTEEPDPQTEEPDPANPPAEPPPTGGPDDPTTPPDDDPGDEEPGAVGPGGNGGRGHGHPPPDQGGHDQGDGDEHQNASGGTKVEEPTLRKPDGTPTRSNPTTTVADFGPAPIGVANPIIDQFSIPPFLLPIYQACGTEYGIPWEVLASINRIETAFGTNLNVSTAGAMGWMQFIPSTWDSYGVDANNDGRKDPYNPVDAVCAAARYLNAAGGAEDLRGAIFAYNHADWYVDEVLLYARQYGQLPDDLVGSLTGLTEGARFPVAARARYADDISERRALERSKAKRETPGNAADVVSGSPTRRGINIYARDGAPVVAVNDGVIKRMGHDKDLGRYIVLQDAYGNRFTYAQLGEISKVHPVPKQKRLTADDFRLVSPKQDAAPDEPASNATDRARAVDRTASNGGADRAGPERTAAEPQPANTEDARRRLFAFPQRPRNVDRAELAGQVDDLLHERMPAYESFKNFLGGVLRFDRKTMELRPLREGSKVVAGTVLGRIGQTDELAPHVHFAIRPAGRGAPRIDPKPILDGWKLLEATAIYRAAGKNPFAHTGATVGQILLMSKEQLQRRVLADPALEIYECGREDIRTGQIDRRILALLEYLVERGYRMTITSLKCGHSFLTTSGNVSEHSSGNAVDIAMINGVPVLGHQGPGTLAESLVKDVLQLQGTMAPHQVISLMDFGPPSFAMSDHDDHVHVGFQPQYGPGSDSGKQLVQVLKPDQWQRLIDRIAGIDNPKVPTSPSRFAVPTKKGEAGGHRASGAHRGE